MHWSEFAVFAFARLGAKYDLQIAGQGSDRAPITPGARLLPFKIRFAASRSNLLSGSSRVHGGLSQTNFTSFLLTVP